jgi:hypothetical protein
MTPLEVSKADPHLGFLVEANNDDLRILVDYLTKNSNGESRLTEGLTSKDKYKIYYPDSIHEMLPEAVHELRLFGGNTFANIYRGGVGVSYEEILTDVCKKMKVSFNQHTSIEKKEQYLLQKVFDDSIADMSEDELSELMKDMNIPTTSFGKQAMLAALQTAIKQSGFMFYKMSVIVANQVARMVLGRGLTFATNAGITRGVSMLAGPVGWAITIAWTAFDIAAPAYRVTIPAVIHIAYMRALYEQKKVQNPEEVNQQ